MYSVVSELVEIVRFAVVFRLYLPSIAQPPSRPSNDLKQPDQTYPLSQIVMSTWCILIYLIGGEQIETIEANERMETIAVDATYVKPTTREIGIRRPSNPSYLWSPRWPAQYR